MINKNITMRTLNDDGEYNKLYPQTSATQSEVSADTQQLFGQSTVDACLDKLANTISTLGRVLIKVVDANNNPIEGAVITGISGRNVTDAQGGASGILINNPITVKSPYVDLQDTTADASDYTGSLNTLTVTLPIAGENAIRRFTTSKSVTFSKMLKTVDVCCVGGGGGGGNLIITSAPAGDTYPHISGGGGGGAIVNSYGKSINADTDYILSVGSGGSSGYTGGTGGTTTFLSVSATGGGGAYVYQPTSGDPTGKGGSAGSSGSGKGGDYNHDGENSIISEFDDGVTFYSGGGGAGNRKGGTPNGANGAYITGGYPNPSYPHSATTPGIGGGGGGATYDGQIRADLPSSGGSGLVAIRFHF